MIVALAFPPLDTATIAVHLGCTPHCVRRLAAAGIITPLFRATLNGRGRPAMWFDLGEVDRNWTDVQASGRVVLDKGRVRLRK